MTDTETGIEEIRAIVTSILLTALALVAGVLLVVLAGSAIALAGIELGSASLLVIALVLVQGFSFGGISLLYLYGRGLGFEYVPAEIPTARDVIWIVSGYVLALVGAFTGLAITLSADLETANNETAEIGMEHPEVLLLLVPLSFLLIGPGEELLFRGIVQGRLRESFGPVGAIGLASAIFAGIHFFALTGGTSGRLATVAVLFLPSLVFGTAYERTDNIVVPSVIHGAYNATLFSLLYVSIKLSEAQPPAFV